MTRDRGEAATVLIVAGASLSLTGMTLAVSDNAANNASFTLAIIGIITALLSGATWLNRRWNRALEARIREATDAAAEAVARKVDEGFRNADRRIDRTEARQLAMQEQLRDLNERFDARS